MNVNYVFFDTEFTNLGSPALISLGAVSSSGEEFYAEILDGWHLEDCSLFTLTQVLPFLAEGRMEQILQQAFGEKFSILRIHTDEQPQWQVLANPDKNFSAELWSWVAELERRAPLADPAGKIGEPDLGALLVKETPILRDEAVRLDLKASLAEYGALTRDEAARELSRWIAAFPGKVQMIWDYQADRDLVDSLLRSCRTYPENLNLLPLSLPDSLEPQVVREIKEAGDTYIKMTGRQHHALEDARAFQIRWQKGRELNAY